MTRIHQIVRVTGPTLPHPGEEPCPDCEGWCFFCEDCKTHIGQKGKRATCYDCDGEGFTLCDCDSPCCSGEIPCRTCSQTGVLRMRCRHPRTRQCQTCEGLGVLQCVRA
jgi:hypothetical protein